LISKSLRGRHNFGFVFFALSIAPGLFADSIPQSEELYRGWFKMYDLQFAEAHRVFAQWKQSHPTDSLGPASDGAAYLFSELARLGALESEFFVDDGAFLKRKQLLPDLKLKSAFDQQLDQANGLADSALQKSPTDTNALFAKSLVLGLRADYTALVAKQYLSALNYTKESRVYANKVMVLDPGAFDAYLGPGVENYLLSLRPAPVRALLRLAGWKIDREAGIEQLKMTALHGYYLEPFAKLLLAVAALRDKHPEQARELLSGLHDRFPGNQLYLHELDRLRSRAR